MNARTIVSLLALAVVGGGLIALFLHLTVPATDDSSGPAPYQPRKLLDTSGGPTAYALLPRWNDHMSLEEIRDAFQQLEKRVDATATSKLTDGLPADEELEALMQRAYLSMYQGKAQEAYGALTRARKVVESSESLDREWLYSIIFFQGVAALRRGENENCLHCRGEGACVFPLRPTAVHTRPDGSRIAIRHFTEYLKQFPDDEGVRWLLNLAYMTLGEHPRQVPPEHLLTFDTFGSEFDIGRFKDIAHVVGLSDFEHVNMSGGAIMDDFDNDGLLDVVVTDWDPAMHMRFFRNKGDGTFEDRTKAAGLEKQLGGFNLVQTDYNNDGFLDILVVRGAWVPYPMRPSLLRNNGNGTFTDVTRAAGLVHPVSSNCGAWADYDNDGHLDLYLCNETGPNLLYRNKGDGTFEEVAAQAGVAGKNKYCKAAAWIDYDNDGYPDLFVNYYDSTPQLFHNNRNGTFTDVTAQMGIDGPQCGFSCWAFDYDNDGYLDIFATCFQRTVDAVVCDMRGKPCREGMDTTRLFRNIGGKRFQDVSKETGVDKVFATMGSNFADFDNDGFLDFYLGTGEPAVHTIVPNRMFKNVGGRRFAEITTTSGTGHLQKGHGVACGDWDRDGNVDLFMVLGGAIPGDRYHNVLFQNPGQGNNWLTVKLIGKKTNRAAIGARIKVVTDADKPLTVHRHVASGSSFGANPLQQTIGLARARSVATLEIRWPTSQTTQVFHNVAVNQAIEVTEFAKSYRKLSWTRVPVPKE
jgi:hypothetical protein